MKQLFWHPTNVAFSCVFATPLCLAEYMVEPFHSRDHSQNRTTERFPLEGTSGGDLNQLSSLIQANFRTGSPVKLNLNLLKKVIFSVLEFYTPDSGSQTFCSQAKLSACIIILLNVVVCVNDILFQITV